MKKFSIIALLLIVVFAVLGLLLADNQSDNILSNEGINISIMEPIPDSVVDSPLEIRGEARGPWYFEANFSVYIEDANGVRLGGHYATAQGDWMTEEFVPFSAELSFSEPTTDTGVLVLEKANPSGLPEHADELRIPVRFSVNE
ncbi:MAG: Gmad2 immunoglobulin-like domain-containing protein [Candidatus Paceibacterota bacterium]